MSEIVIFHRAQGLTPGILAFANELRQAGHVVHTPDLFEGLTFDTLEERVNHVQRTGFEEIVKRGIRAAGTLPAELVYPGFSMGVLPAQCLAQTRRGARGALLFHACLPVAEFAPEWPKGVPVQIHAMKDDPFFVADGDIDAARALVSGTEDAELFLYPGDRHLFADPSLPDFDAAEAAELMRRVLDFLATK